MDKQSGGKTELQQNGKAEMAVNRPARLLVAVFHTGLVASEHVKGPWPLRSHVVCRE